VIPATESPGFVRRANELRCWRAPSKWAEGSRRLRPTSGFLGAALDSLQLSVAASLVLADALKHGLNLGFASVLFRSALYNFGEERLHALRPIGKTRHLKDAKELLRQAYRYLTRFGWLIRSPRHFPKFPI
jgi:hypothetical protein